MTSFRTAIQERLLIFDGAMGTQVQNLAARIGDSAYRGQDGNSDIVSLTLPDEIAAIHAAYAEAGADCLETNTFGANTIVQDEFGNDATAVHQMNVASAQAARAAFGGREGFVIGSMGPGTKSPTLGQASFEDLRSSYEVQTLGLLEGGVDGLIIETAFDLLQVKAALAAIMDAFAARAVTVPVITQVTIETTGTMLLGTEILAALAALDPYRIVEAVGINCATGPSEMVEHVRALCERSIRPVSIQPNAGLPVMRDGAACYELTPSQLLEFHRVFVAEFGASIVGGCCGTTPEHIKILADGLRDVTPAARTPLHEPSIASLYQPQPLKQETSFLVIGERCNAQGSRRFRDLVEVGDWDATVDVAREQIAQGAHALDVSVDFTGRDGAVDMGEVVSRFATQATQPLVFDSTEPEVIEAGLMRYGGRAVINSINLEEGRGPDTRLEKNLRNAVRFGAAVVALAIDETGQATTADWKLDVCRRLHDIATLEYGLTTDAIVFDPIVLPISTGMEETRRAGIETLDAVQRLATELPEAGISLGVSNVSFGLNPAARQVLNSMFLHEAVARGATAAIVHAAQILPLHRIDDEIKQLALDLIYDRRTDDHDPLGVFIERFQDQRASLVSIDDVLAGLTLEERLARRIVDAARKGLEDDLTDALQQYSALEIVNSFLLDGMRVVGERFASGEMQLPFVLQSAETMKAAVAFLEPHMERVEGSSKGTIILATVKGDVHDIGKNLVDIILTNNGYRVVNIGIKQPINEILAAAEREQADAIGLSGLLVKSTIVMRDDLDELARRGLHERFTVLLGGAALTRTYVEHDLRDRFPGRVFYGRDAFEGLRVMDALIAEKGGGPAIEYEVKQRRTPKTRPAPEEPGSRSDVRTDVEPPTPPFYGTRVVKGLPVAEVSDWLNEVALFRGQWGFKTNKGEPREDYDRRLEDEAEPELNRLLAWCIEKQVLQPAVVYGYFRCRSDGDRLLVWPESSDEPEIFTFPRQQRDRRLNIADFFRSDVDDVVAFHLVTMGQRISEETARLFAEDAYREYLFLHGLGVEMAEALAEYWHARVRRELGIHGEDAKTVQGMFKQGYRGSRYSFGYPACPNLEDQQQLFRLLQPERIGVALTEEFQLDPEQSTSAIIVHHPEARYFSA